MDQASKSAHLTSSIFEDISALFSDICQISACTREADLNETQFRALVLKKLAEKYFLYLMIFYQSSENYTYNDREVKFEGGIFQAALRKAGSYL